MSPDIIFKGLLCFMVGFAAFLFIAAFCAAFV